MIEPTEQYELMSDLLDDLSEVSRHARALESGREVALVRTKLDEARLWLQDARDNLPAAGPGVFR